MMCIGNRLIFIYSWQYWHRFFRWGNHDFCQNKSLWISPDDEFMYQRESVKNVDSWTELSKFPIWYLRNGQPARKWLNRYILISLFFFFYKIGLMIIGSGITLPLFTCATDKCVHWSMESIPHKICTLFRSALLCGCFIMCSRATFTNMD